MPFRRNRRSAARPAKRAASSPGPEAVQDPALSLAAARVRSNPNDLDALLVVGTTLLARGQADPALECFDRITCSSPTYPGIWRLKAKAFEALGDPKNAERCRRRGADPRS